MLHRSRVGALALFRILLSLALIIVPEDHRPSIATPTVYYVATDGDDSDAGSIALPWGTVGYALLRLQPGDTLLIREGIYSGVNTTLLPANSGTENAPITVKAYPNEEVIIQDSKFYRFGASWWIIEGLIFAASDHWQLFRFGDDERIAGAPTVKVTGIIVRDCIFRNAKFIALNFINAENVLVESNRFFNLRKLKVGSDLVAIGITYIVKDAVIRGNEFEDIGSDGIHILSLTGMAGADIGRVEISNNHFWVNRPYPYADEFHNVGENAIDIKGHDGMGPILILDNLIEGFRPSLPEQDCSGSWGAGIVIHDGAQNVTLERNLFRDNTTGLEIKEGAGNVIIKDNISRDASPAMKNGVLFGGFGLWVRDAANIEVRHNIFYKNTWYMKSYDVISGTLRSNVFIKGKGDIRLWDSDYNTWSQVENIAVLGEHDTIADDLVILPIRFK